MGGRFDELPREGIDARAGLPLERQGFVHLTFEVHVRQPKEGVGQVHGNRVPPDDVVVVHHVAESNF